MMLDHDVHGRLGQPAVLLLGSLGADRRMWDPQVRALAGRWRVITADLRGHGRSPAPGGPYRMAELAEDVLDVLGAVNERRVHLVGLSLGGAVAQTLALARPELVASLTLVSTAAKFGTPEAWRGKSELVAARGTAALADAVVGNWFTDDCRRMRPELPQRFAEGIRATPDAGYAGCCGALSGFDSREALAGLEPRLARRTLVIAGEQDTSTPLPVVRDLHGRIPGSAMITVSPAKHLLTAERPELVNPILAGWFAGG